MQYIKHKIASVKEPQFIIDNCIDFINEQLGLYPGNPFLLKIQDYYTTHIPNDLDNEEDSVRANKLYGFRLNVYNNFIMHPRLLDLDSLMVLLSQIPTERYSNDYYIKNHFKVIEINVIGHLLLANSSIVTPQIFSNILCDLIENLAFYEPTCISDILQRTLALLLITFTSYYSIFNNIIKSYLSNPILKNGRTLAYPELFNNLLNMINNKAINKYLMNSLLQILKAQSAVQTDVQYPNRYS